MIDRCVQVAGSELKAAEESARSESARTDLAQARTALTHYGPSWKTEFPVLLARGMDGLLDPGREHAPPSFADSEVSIRTLLQDAEVVRFIEIFRVRQSVVLSAQKPLGMLDLLINSALGMSTVQHSLNPVRPEVLCMTLQRLMESTSEPEALRHHWTRHMAGTFGFEACQLYEQLVEMLQQSGVEAAQYRVRLGRTVSRRPADGLGAAARKKASGVTSVAGSKRRLSSQRARFATPSARLEATAARIPFMSQLAGSEPKAGATFMREFLYRSQWIKTYDEQLPAGYYEAAHAEQARVAALPNLAFDADAHTLELKQRRAQDVMLRSQQTLGVGTDLAPADWGEFASALARRQVLMDMKVGAERISQVLGLDAVRILIGQIAEDVRVLVPVRQAFVALEPALLRLAINEPRFLGVADHPARMLMEHVAQRSLRYNDEFDPQFQQFMASVRATVCALTSLASIKSDDFEAHRRKLLDLSQAEDELEQAVRRDVVLSMEFAQARQSLADRIATELSRRSDLVGIHDTVIADFLYREWSLVLAHAQLTKIGDDRDPGGYLAVVRDLLWSVNPDVTRADPARLSRLVPRILRILHDGMEMLGKQPEETQSFFDVLMQYHAPVLRQRRVQDDHETMMSGPSPLDSRSGSHAVQKDGDKSELPAPQKAELPWLGEQEREAAGFEEHEDTKSPPVGQAESTDAGAADRDGRGQGLRIGSGQAQAPVPMSPADLEAALQDEAARLRPGHWVDLFVRGGWRRAQVSWTSDNGSLFMFISHGGQAHTMTRRGCEKLLRNGLLRPVDRDPVFERALQAVSEKTAVDGDGRPVPDHSA